MLASLPGTSQKDKFEADMEGSVIELVKNVPMRQLCSRSISSTNILSYAIHGLGIHSSVEDVPSQAQAHNGPFIAHSVHPQVGLWKSAIS